jgi:hypothetical protein
MTIPDHIMARAAMAHAEFADSRVADNLTDIIAAARMAAVQEEREQCADLCGNQAPTVVGQLFAGLIRNRSVTEGE